MHWQGSFVALVTPMTEKGDVALDQWASLIEEHLATGTAGIVVNGTTGESPTVHPREFELLLSEAVSLVKGRIPVIAGTGTNSTEKTIEQTQIAAALGANACLVVTPYYNKPTQKGLIAHYQAVADVGLPMILYNAPGRSLCDCLPETFLEIAKHPHLLGLKECVRDLSRLTLYKEKAPHLSFFTGEDDFTLDFMKAGGDGVISVTANVVPKLMHDFMEHCLQKNWPAAEHLHEKLLPLHHALFVQTNPIPVKWALHSLGKIGPGIRLPLLPLESSYRDQLEQVVGARHDEPAIL